MKRILIFGDSIMRGVYYSEEAGRHKLFGERLRGLKELGYEVKNCSVMGATIGTGRELIEKRLTIPAENTTVIFEYGGNDCDFRWADVSADPDGQFEPNTPETQFLSTYRDMISYAREKGAVPVIASLVPIDADRYMNWITRNLSYQNILHWLGDVAMLSRWQEHYSHMAGQLAREMGCPLLDLRTAFLTSHDFKNLLCEDGIHPTPLGHARIDAALEQFFLA